MKVKAAMTGWQQEEVCAHQAGLFGHSESVCELVRQGRLPPPLRSPFVLIVKEAHGGQSGGQLCPRGPSRWLRLLAGFCVMYNTWCFGWPGLLVRCFCSSLFVYLLACLSASASALVRE